MTKLMSMAARVSVVFLSVLAFASGTEAGAVLPAGTYDQGRNTMEVKLDGDYRITYREGVVTRVLTGGFALEEGYEVCSSGDKTGNLWTVSNSGTGNCYRASVRGKRLIIDNLGNPSKALGGVWKKR